MQYILTEEEYNTLISSHREKLAKLRTIIGKLCKDVADHKPVRKKQYGCDDALAPYECIHTEGIFGYCDGCPVNDVCTLEQEFSQ